MTGYVPKGRLVKPNQSGTTHKLFLRNKRIHTEPSLADRLKELGWKHAQKFTQQKCAEGMMEVYKILMA